MENMKRIVLSFLFVALAATASAQYRDISWGVKGGLNLSNIRNTSHPQPKTGANAGVFLTLDMGRGWSFQPELMYSEQGNIMADQQGDNAAYDETYAFDCINLPLMFRYRVAGGLHVEFGLQAGWKISARYHGENYNVDADSPDYAKMGWWSIPSPNYNTFDLQMPLGLSYDFKPGVFVSARYNVGLTNTFQGYTYNPYGNTQAVVFQLSAGWRFRVRE